MAAGPSWFIDQKNGCFKLKLFVTWEARDDPDIGSRSEFLETYFTLPEDFCKVSAAELIPEPSPMIGDKDDGKSDDGLKDGDVVVQNVEGGDQTEGQADEDDGMIWLDEDSEEDDE